MDRRHDIVSSGVAEIVLRQIVSSQWREIAERLPEFAGCPREPRVAPKIEVPEGVMRVDDRTGFGMERDPSFETPAHRCQAERKRWTN
jgi:hypothetical protein